MKMTLYLFSILLLCSCSKQHIEETETIETIAEVSDSALNNIITNDTIGLLQRDSLLIIWCDNLMHIANTDKNFSLEKRPEPNKFIKGQIDTIDFLTFKESNIEIYRTPDKNILMSSDIRNAEIPLSKEMKTGISRQELLTYLKAESDRDTLHIVDFEGNTSVILILKNNLLTRIIYCGYVD